MFLKNKKITTLILMFLMMLSFSALSKPIGVYKDISNSKWKDTPISIRKVLINLNLLNNNVDIFETQWLKEIKTRYGLYGLSQADVEWVNAVLQRNNKTWTPRNDYAPKKESKPQEIMKSDDSKLIHETEEEKRNAPLDQLGRRKEKRAETSSGISLIPSSKEMTMKNDNLGKNLKPVKIYTGEDLAKATIRAKQNRGQNKMTIAANIKNKSNNKSTTTSTNAKQEKASNDDNITSLSLKSNEFNFDIYKYINYKIFIALNKKEFYSKNDIDVEYDYYVQMYLTMLKEKEIKQEQEILKIKELEKISELKQLKLEKFKEQKLLEEQQQIIAKRYNENNTRSKKEVILILSLLLFLSIGVYTKIRGAKIGKK